VVQRRGLHEYRHCVSYGLLVNSEEARHAAHEAAAGGKK